ncbi:hypothetical protein [Planomicrobium soli]|uniref:hypothetical protein n=1 Tax=Planomicrobium soli TaxID=1176648 RepID=UPI0011B2859F|nr:hypothetical protein [Planomicrobium soli]
MELLELTYSPLYLVMAVMCSLYLILFRKEKGCMVLAGKIYSIFILAVYLIAFSLFLRSVL